MKLIRITVVALFAFGDGQHYSLVINAMSALFSAFTILFLFWTITHLVRRLLNKEFENITVAEEIATLFAGAVGALCFTFSDTFWFSAVEGEVYAVFLEQDSTIVPKFAYRSFCPMGILLGLPPQARLFAACAA